MKRFYSFVVLFLSFCLVSAPIGAGEEKAQTEAGSSYELHSFAREISFDTHPLTIEPLAGKFLNFGTEQIQYSIDLLESWDPTTKEPVIKQIGFKVYFQKPGQEKVTVDVSPIPLLSKKLKKGEILKSVQHENFEVAILCDGFKTGKKHPETITISFKLKGYGKGGDSPVASPTIPVLSVVDAPVSPNLPSTERYRVAVSLFELANKMNEAQTNGKINLLKKALAAIPVDDISTEAVALRAKIENEKKLLEAKPVNEGVSTSSTPTSTRTSTPTSSNSPASPLFEEAKKCFALGDEAKGREHLRNALEKDPDFQAGWALLAKNAYKNSKYARAKEASEKALNLDRNDVPSAEIFFKANYYLGDAQTGIDILEQLVKNNPKSLKAYLILADAYFQSGNLPACETACNNLLAISPENSRAKELLAKTKKKME